MDKRLHKIVEDMSNNTLGLDDTFQFKCRTCGKCCKNRHDIMLNTRDLYNIARLLGRTLQYVIERYCDVYIGDSSRIPIVRLKPQGPEQSCPLLIKRRCIAHKAKPVICAIFPLGRATKMDITETGAKTPEKFEPVYFIQSDTCGSREQTHTVRSWLEQFGIPVEDEFYSLWTETLTSLSKTFRNLESLKVPNNSMDTLWGVAFTAMYIDYDKGTDLIPQFRENALKLKESFAKIEAEAQTFFGGLSDGT